MTTTKFPAWTGLAAVLAALLLRPATAHAQGTAFTYQGRLDIAGAPANVWPPSNAPSDWGGHPSRSRSDGCPPRHRNPIMKSTSAKIGLLGCLAALLPIGQAPGAPPSDANEAAPRPYYIVAHNPNTIGNVIDALAVGAHALEPDIAPHPSGIVRLVHPSNP